MKNPYPFRIFDPETHNLDLSKERKPELKEDENKKKVLAQNNVINMVKFEDCDFENTTIILNFEAPD
ncbi:MAG: hypothetical protein V1762_00725 [Nitrospirota bacterium]